jgi:photosystem II stability/assembly factor-like uncharacterized protein
MLGKGTILGFLALLAFLLVPVRAQAAWQQSNGPAGVTMFSLAITPGNNQVMFAGTKDGVFKSSDGGASWSPSGTTTTYVGALAIDPLNTQTVYAGGYGAYKSSDGGTTWSAINTGLTAWYIYSFAFDPNNSQTIYAGTIKGIFKSTNGGGSWTAINSGVTNTDISVIAVSPTDSQTLYAGAVAYNSYVGGMYKSTNGGTSWTAINSGMISGTLPFATVGSLAVSPTGLVMYAGTNQGIFKTTDGGGSWSAANTGLSFSGSFASLAIDPVDSQVVYTGTNNGSVFSTVNGGSSWSVVASGLTDSRVYSTGTTGVWTSSAMVQLPAPVISGVPAGSAKVGAFYIFTPSSSNATSFSVANKPSWASFDATSGALYGTPAGADVGSYTAIVITASNRSGSVSLAPFSIQVTGTPGDTGGGKTTSVPVLDGIWMMAGILSGLGLLGRKRS